MDQKCGLTVNLGDGSIATRKSVLSPVSRLDKSHLPHARDRLIEALDQCEGMTVRLRLDQKLQRFFPERSREARNSFFRFFRDIEHEVCLEGAGDLPAVRLSKAVRTGVLQRLDRRILKRLYRPMSAREAAGFLRLDKKAFRHLRQETGIQPSERILANRHGRSYSYAAFAISDVIRMQSAIAALPPRTTSTRSAILS